MGHEKRTALKHYDKSRHVHMRRSKSVTGVMRDAESRTSQQVIPRKRSAERLQWQVRVIVIVMSPHHGGPNTPSPPRSMTTLVAVLRVVSPSGLNPPRLFPLRNSISHAFWRRRSLTWGQGTRLCERGPCPNKRAPRDCDSRQRHHPRHGRRNTTWTS